MLVLFENLTPVCMLVNEALEIPKELGGATPYTGVEEEPEVCHMY